METRRPKEQELRGYAILLLAGAIWGTSGLFVRELSAMGAGSTWISFCRLIPGAVFLFFFVGATRGLSALKIGPRAIFASVSIGIFSKPVRLAVDPPRHNESRVVSHQLQDIGGYLVLVF